MPSEMEIGEMKPGDYMIHVYLQKGKNFKIENEGQSLNALIAVNSGGSTSYSKCKTDCPAGSDQEEYWGEHFFFEPRGVTGDEISSYNIQFKLLDKGVFRDIQLGIFEIDVSQIYFMNDDHAILHQWVALTNPESSDSNSIKGYLKVSVAIQGPGDSSIKLVDDEGAENSEECQVMMPASIKKEYKQVIISFIEAQKLPKMDTFGSIDAFIQTKFQKKQYQTQVVKAVNERCSFECSFKIAVQWPLSNDRLILKIMDADNMGSECIGSIYMSLKEVISLYSNQGGQIMWKNVYGGPIGLAPSANKKLMNENPEIASLWKGRILMHIQAFDAKAPEQGKFAIDQTIMQMCAQLENTVMKEYEVQAEVGGGICLPENRAYKVRIQIADFFLDTQEAKSPKESANNWNQRFEAVKFQAPYSSIEELDRVYFYLMDGSSPICFWRGKASDFVDRNPSFKWYPLINDRAIGKVEEAHDAGMIQIKLSINDLQRNPPVVWNQWPAWKEKPKKRADPRILRCYIYQCKDLPAADSDGNSDPFIQIWDADNKDIKTITIEDSLNPIFMQVFEVQVDVSKRENAAPIVLNVFDSDVGMVNDSRDFLGRAIIKMDDPCVQDLTNGGDMKKLDIPVAPTWHSVRAGSDEKLPECGKILCSFTLAPIDAKFREKAEDFKLSSLVKTKELNIDIHALGLRELESFGIMPIKKAFVRFRPRSLLPPERAFAVTNVETEPKESGPNPNINTLVTFQAQLPVDNLYCPRLACEAYDYVCKGISQPKIGTFSINVGDIYFQQQKERVSQVEKAQKLINWLNELYATANPGSVLSHKQKIAKTFGVELTEEITSLADGMSRRGKKKKKKKLSLAQLKAEMVEQEDKPAASPDKSGSISIDLMGDTSIQDNRDPTIMIMEDDYGDENMLAPLLRDDGPSDYIPLRQTGSAIGTAAPLDLTEDLDSLSNSSLLRKLISGSYPIQDDQSQEQQAKLEKLLERSNKADKDALKDLGTALAKLRKKREERATKQGGNEKKRQNKILATMEAKLLANLQQAKAKQKQLDKDQVKIKKMLATLVLAERGVDMHKNILMPTYKHDDRLKTFREDFIPPKSLFLPVGFDGGVTCENPQGRNMHYRKFYMDELENNQEIFARKPFHEFSLSRGQSRGLAKGMLTSLFSKAAEDPSGFTSTVKSVGKFKGYVRVYNEEDDEEFAQEKMAKIDEMEQIIMKLHLKKFGKPLELDIQSLDTSEEKHYFRHLLIDLEAYSDELYKFFIDSSFESILIKQLSSPQDCLVRLYLLEGFDFASRDMGSFSDPYMIVKCGKTVHNMRDKYQLDEPNPKIHQVFEFNCRFPGTSPLEIEAYDYDDLFGDDLIGRTVLDLDDRFFSPEWRGLLDKPIEYRELYHPSTSLAQGTVLCWVDIFEQDGKRNADQEPWNIQPEPITDYQLRLSVYEAANVPMEDAEGTSDVFVRAWIDENDQKETDTHWRCSSGSASFNYRLLFDFKSPTYQKSENEAYKLKLQLYDRDLFKSNDFICLFEIDLRLLVLDCRISKKPQQLSQKYYSTYFKNAYAKECAGKDTQLSIEFFDEDSFWLSVKRPEDTVPIKIRLDIRILPGVDAVNQAVGAARTEPNHSPKLSEPVGRMSMSLNPLTMLGQLVGPELRTKFQQYLCMITCVALLIAMTPMILSNIITKLLLSPIGLG